VLLLDEATSALDSENGVMVQSALAADREKARIKTLVAKDGLYARLAKLQFETGEAALKTGEAAAAE
jgi:ATP-binding cassette subfamily B protein